jgi:hypothetical protein
MIGELIYWKGFGKKLLFKFQDINPDFSWRDLETP